MKTQQFSLNAIQWFFFSKMFFRLSLITIIGLTACQKDDEAASIAFEGTYIVREDGEDVEDEYTITVERKSANDYLIHNFADFMNVGVKATGSGTSLYIPAQQFVNPGSGNSITVSGVFTLKGDMLEIQYSVSGFAGNFSSSGKAIKQ